MSDEQYYWEKAEFQDPVTHREHLGNYKKGIRSSSAFDEAYMVEAMEELKKDPVEYIEKVLGVDLSEYQKHMIREVLTRRDDGRIYLTMPRYQGYAHLRSILAEVERMS